MPEAPTKYYEGAEPSELIRQLWLEGEAQLEPGELAAYWKSGTPPPHCDPRLAEKLAAALNLTLQAMDALQRLARYRPVDEAGPVYRRCLFQCGPTVTDLYQEALGREPTEAEVADLLNPADHLWLLPDGVGIRIDRAATFFLELNEASGGTLAPEALLRLAIRGATPETTAGLAPEAVESLTERLQEMGNLITTARKGPPVLEDWLALHDFGQAYR